MSRIIEARASDEQCTVSIQWASAHVLECVQFSENLLDILRCFFYPWKLGYLFSGFECVFCVCMWECIFAVVICRLGLYLSKNLSFIIVRVNRFDKYMFVCLFLFVCLSQVYVVFFPLVLLIDGTLHKYNHTHERKKNRPFNNKNQIFIVCTSTNTHIVCWVRLSLNISNWIFIKFTWIPCFVGFQWENCIQFENSVDVFN